MMSMAYNTSYCAYADAFENGSGVNLKWATWNTSEDRERCRPPWRLTLNGSEEWKTHRLVYMNQNMPRVAALSLRADGRSLPRLPLRRLAH